MHTALNSLEILIIYNDILCYSLESKFILDFREFFSKDFWNLKTWMGGTIGSFNSCASMFKTY